MRPSAAATVPARRRAIELRQVRLKRVSRVGNLGWRSHVADRRNDSDDLYDD
jgi:hypothetical protein